MNNYRKISELNDTKNGVLATNGQRYRNSNPSSSAKNKATRLGGLQILPVRLYIPFMGHGLRSGIGAGHQTQHRINGNDGRTAVTDEGKGQADNGHGADAHADVDDHLENKSRCGTVADQAAHIVRTPDAHVDTAGDDGKLQNHDGHTAEETQLLADGGEDVVRMLGEQGTCLSTVAIEQTLSRQTAAGKGTEVDGVVIPFVDTLGVDGIIKENQNTVSLVLAEELPQNGEGSSDAADGQSEPQQAHTTGKSHTDEHEHEDQGNTCVGGDGHIQANHDAQMQYHLHDSRDTGNSVFI